MISVNYEFYRRRGAPCDPQRYPNSTIVVGPLTRIVGRRRAGSKDQNLLAAMSGPIGICIPPKGVPSIIGGGE
jgi:hypothetical protein